MVPTFGQNRDIDDDLYFPGRIGFEHHLPLSGAHVAKDDGGRVSGLIEGCRDVDRVRDGRAEDHGLAVARLSCQCRTTSSVMGARFMIAATAPMS